MPEQEEPGWPSADADSTSGVPADQGGDGGATAQLPIPGRPGPNASDGRTEQLPVPKVTPAPDAATSWFRPQQAQQQAPRQQQPPQRQQPPQQQRPPQPPRQDQRPPQRPAPGFDPFAKAGGQLEDPRADQYQPPRQQRPDQQQPQQQWPDQQQQQRPDQQQWPDQRRLPQIPPAPHAVPMRIEPTGELRPAEATTGADRGVPRTRPVPPPVERPAEPQREPEPEPEALSQQEESAPPPESPIKTKRKRRGLLIGGFALLVVVALGVVAALPQVSNRLGLPWAPNAPKGDEPALVALTQVLHGPQDSAPSPTAAALTAALQGPAGSAALGQLTGSVLDVASGTELWDRNATTALTPASTTKVLTVTAALLTLDHGMRLKTKVVQGAQPGTVVLVAGGDLTLNSRPAGQESKLFPGSAHLSDLIAQVKKANPNVTKVQLDTSIYNGPTTAPGWDPTDAPSVSAAPMVPIMLDGGRTGDLDSEDVMRTGNPGTAVEKALASGLGAQPGGTAKAPADAKVLGEVQSAPLTELVDDLLTNSDNNLADAVARQVAIAKGDEPSFAGAVKATMDVLSQNGFDVSGVTLNDNCGLSTLNKIPAKLLSQIMAVAAGPDGKDPRTAKMRAVLDGLPIAAVSGTLAEPRYTKPSNVAGRGWVRAKTGSLSGVNTLAGVVLDTDGRLLAFALMSTGADTNSSRDALDTIAATLRGCGCH